MTGSSNETWLVDEPCVGEATGCEIVHMDNYGTPTGFLWCAVHGAVVGRVFWLEAA